jgi:hypothetical protein
VCAVQDGAEWEQGLVDVLRADAVRILDFPHAVEHLTAGAQPVLGLDAAELRLWLDQQAHTLKHAADGARQVLAALAKLPVQHAADPSAATEVRDRTMTYFTKRLALVRYAEFQVAGYPIGSGSTESANKIVVEARLKAAGCIGRVLTLIHSWRCVPSRAPTAGQRLGRGLVPDSAPRLNSGAIHAGEPGIRRQHRHPPNSSHPCPAAPTRNPVHRRHRCHLAPNPSPTDDPPLCTHGNALARTAMPPGVIFASPANSSRKTQPPTPVNGV